MGDVNSKARDKFCQRIFIIVIELEHALELTWV
jgi:hypothetical protein